MPRKLKWYETVLLSLLALVVVFFVSKHLVFAATPDFEANCNTDRNTVGALYPSATDLSSPDGTGSTSILAQAHICNKAPAGYGVTDLHIVWYDVVPDGTSATMSPKSRDYNLGNWFGAGATTNAVAQDVNLSGLQVGNNCWKLYYSMNGLYGGTRVDSGRGFYWRVCITYTQLIKPPGNPQFPPGNARLTVYTAGLPGGTSANFSAVKMPGDTTGHGPHGIGDCGTLFTAVDFKVCTSTAPNGIGWDTSHTKSGVPGGTVIRAPATVTRNGVTYTFAKWSGFTGGGDSDQHCINLTSRDVCINLQPGANGKTHISKVTAEYTAPASSALTCSGGGSANTGQSISFTASGGMGSFSWSAPGGSPANGSGASFSTSYASPGAKTITVTSGSNSANCSVTVASPIVITCSGYAVAPDPPEANQPFAVEARFNVSGASAGQKGTMRVKISSQTKEQKDIDLNDPNALKQTFNGFSLSAGTYSGTYELEVDSSTTTCNFNLESIDKPYFEIMDGDIAVGDKGSCGAAWNSSAVSGGKITAWNQALTAGLDPNKGAGTNLAAFAISVIDGFASNKSGADPPKGLTFANNDGSGDFGGNFGATSLPCPTDYYAKSATAASGLVNGDISGLTTDTKTTGPVTITSSTVGSATATTGKRLAIYVDGDVYINGPITVINANPGTTIGKLSSFYLIVKGNIFIASTVTSLQGVYVAQPGGGAYGGGKIYTCYGSGPGNAPTAAEVAGPCKTSLNVKGAFIAKEIKLYRSLGSISNSPAERFIYTPSLWLVAPTSLGDAVLQTQYDAITSLPPVL